MIDVRTVDSAGRRSSQQTQSDAPCNDACDLVGLGAGIAGSTGCGVAVAVGVQAGVLLGGVGAIGGAIISGVGCGLLGGILGLGTGRACEQLVCDGETTPDLVVIDEFSCDPTTACSMTAFGMSSTGATCAFVRFQWFDPSGSPNSYGARTGTVCGAGSGGVRKFVVTLWTPTSPAPCATVANADILFSGEGDTATAPVPSATFIGCV